MKSKIVTLFFAAIFALAFGLGGLAAGTMPLVRTLHGAWKAQSYIPVTAQILDVRLESGGKGTHAVRARYSYEVNRQTYESTRVGLHSSGADNVGDWQRQWHARLLAAHGARQPLTAWVDPDDPRQALLDRSIRWPMVLFLLPFAVLFPLVGLGAAWVFVKTWSAPAQDLAAGPKTLPNSRSSSTLTDRSKLQARFLWIFALFWNLLTWPVAGVFWSTSDRLSGATLFVAVFPAVGLFMLWWAITTSAQLRRARGTVVTTHPRQPSAGETLTIRVELPSRRLAQPAQFQIAITQAQIRDGDSNRTPHAIWSRQQLATPRLLANGHGELRVSFDLPVDGAASDTLKDGWRTVWSLDVVDLSNLDQQSYALDVKGAPMGSAEPARPAISPLMADAVWSPIDELADGTRMAVPPKVLQVQQQAGSWTATLGTRSLRRFTGGLCAAAAAFMYLEARRSFVGDSSADVIWTLVWLALGSLAFALAIHLWTGGWRLLITQRGLTLERSSWLWPRRRELAAADLASYEKKLVSTVNTGAQMVHHYAVYARTQAGEPVQLTPGIGHALMADAVGVRIRDAFREYTRLFSPEGATASATRYRPVLGYGLWATVSAVALMTVSLNATFRSGDPVSVQRIAKDWAIRFDRIKPGGFSYEELALAQDRGDLVRLEELLQQGASANTVFNNGSTLLMLASRRGNLDHVELLLRYGADVNQRDETSNDNRGDTALLVALHAGHESVVRRLLQAGARMDVKNMWDWGPMHMAAQGNCIPCLEIVKSHGFALDTPSPASRGETPAMLAAGKGRLEALQWFVKNGVNLRDKDPHGQTALDWAQFFRHENTAQWIRQQLADLD